jgi:Multisubunit Na+/H+ antiporter, MnhE subunit
MTAIRVSGILVWLLVLWLLLWDDVSAANLVSGVVVGAAVLAFARLPRIRRADDDVARVNVLRTIGFGFYVLYKLVEANVVLAWEIVTPRNTINTGVIAVPLRTESNTAMMVIANVITLTPGTMTIEVAGSPPVIYVNVLHLNDIERVRRDLLRLEELSVRAFGSRAARAQLAERSAA